MSSGTILLVEDSPDDELLTLGAFRKNGFDLPIVVMRTAPRRWTICSAPGNTPGATSAKGRP